MIQLPGQPHVYRRPNLPAFDSILMIDRAFCGALRVARTLGDEYATEGMDLEEVGLAHTMENLLYTIPQKCEAALGEHPTDVASFKKWSNLDMVDRLWWMLREEKSKVRSLWLYINLRYKPKFRFLDQQSWEGGSPEVCGVGRLGARLRGPQERARRLQEDDGQGLPEV